MKNVGLARQSSFFLLLSKKKETKENEVSVQTNLSIADDLKEACAATSSWHLSQVLVPASRPWRHRCG
jgi:hypothetical protein